MDGQTLLKRSEDASNKNQGWLMGDWRWIRETLEVGLTDGWTDRKTDPPKEMRGRI